MMKTMAMQPLRRAAGLCRAISSSRARLGEFSDVLRFDLAAGGALGAATFAHKAALVVNTASKCGFTPQLRALQALHEAYAARGLLVVAVPSNDFGAQEPGDDREIAELYAAPEFGVTFPIAKKSPVVGEQAHPFFARIVTEYSRSVAPTWNFDKFLIDHHGDLRAVFPHDTDPLEPEVAEAIEEVLADLPKPVAPDSEFEDRGGDEEKPRAT